jgi:UDP-3-O-[3-hydroxymyristoyl] glucosamine N-acyltransferase
VGDPAGFTLGQLAQALGATLEGDAGRIVTGVAALDRASPNEISFLTDLRYLAAARRSQAGAFLAGRDADDLPAPVLRTEAPQQSLIDLLRLFHPPAVGPGGIDPTARVALDAQIDPTATVGALAVVEAGARLGAHVRLYPLTYVGAHAELGEGCVLYPHAVVREGVRLGRRVVVHCGAVIGDDGFGYAWNGSVHRKIPQVGTVVVEDDVEIGANTTIDRAMLGETLVRRGTKIDNLVQIAHNVEIGEHCIIVAQVGIAGSCRIGQGVILAGQVGVADHLTIGDGAVLEAQAGISTHIDAGARVFGTPAAASLRVKRAFAATLRLPEALGRLRTLERRLRALETRLGQAGDAAPSPEASDE